MARDPYQELGVPRTATQDELRKAFRKLAKQNHPDTHPGDKAAEERFKRASAAFDIVGDEEKRKKFDRGEIDADGRETFTGRAGPGGPFGGGGPFAGGGGFQGGPGAAGFENIDLNDILGDVFGGRGRSGGFGGFNTRGSDIRAELEIDLEDAIKGATQRISFSDGRTVDIAIPAGAIEGQVLRLKGKGAPGKAGAGDALIELHIRAHPIFKAEGASLVMDLPVSVPDAVLGGKVEAPTPDGPVTLTVPKGSNTGSTLRLRGRGLPNGKGHRGDLLARLVVTLPDGPDVELEKFAETWRKKRPYTPRRRG